MNAQKTMSEKRGADQVLCGVLADDEGAAGGLDDVAGDDGEVVDLHDAGDLGEQAVNEPEVSAGEADPVAMHHPACGDHDQEQVQLLGGVGGPGQPPVRYPRSCR